MTKLSTNDRSRRRRRERAVWGSLTALLLAFVLVFTVTPSLLADSYSETDRALEVFESVLRFIERNYVDEIDPQVLLEGALKGMFESIGDPHSAYLSGEQMRKLTDTTTGEFGGVGMYVSKQRADGDGSGFVEVVAPIEDTPAYRAGVLAGDLIVALKEQGAEEFLSTEGLSIDEAVDLLRGAPGTSITIRIRRGARAEFPVTLERAIIEVPTVKFSMMPDGIGFLRIIQFTPRTAQRVEDALNYFAENSQTGIIMDLRSNPGGLLDAVIDVADKFFTSGTVVGTAGRIPQENKRFTATRRIVADEDVPMVVLIDGGSASAAEILAGALQDRNRAFLVGQTTYGKGSVQQIRRISGGGFRLTMSRYYLPSGRFIDQVGVEPDKRVDPPELTEEQNVHYARLRTTDRVGDFVRSTGIPTDEQVSAFVEYVQDEGYDIPERWIRQTVRNEVNRQQNIEIDYDLEFDVMLQEAVRLLKTGVVSGR
jgi:carboxyl-terminal processing protease